MDPLRTTLDDLAGLVADVDDDSPTRHVLAGVVVDVERMARAELAGTDDVLPVLVRRFARAHRLLLGAAGVRHDAVDRLERHAAVLRDPLAALVAAWDELQEGRPGSTPARPPVLTSPAGSERSLCEAEQA